MKNVNKRPDSVRTRGADKLTDRKHADILDAAIVCFSEKGFDNTSMDAIASKAKVSKRTVYNHFASKDVLFTAIVNKLKENASRALPCPYVAGKALEPQLESFCHAVIEFQCQDVSRALARILISRFIRTPQLGFEMFGHGKVFESALILWIQSAQKDNRLIEFDVTLGARQVIAMLEGFSVWPQLILNAPNPNQVQREQIVSSIVALFLNTYRSQSTNHLEGTVNSSV
jgi:TetR/AcrR family transcriptional regulator of autoinduction and epiphytic fitness